MLSEEKPQNGYVYFIASYELQMVKIGYSKDVSRRFRFLEVSCPVRLFVPLVISGTKATEKRTKLPQMQEDKNCRLVEDCS